MGYKPVSLSENVNVSQRMPLRSVLLMLGGLFVVLPALFLVIVLMVGAAAPYVPAAWERSMGDDLREELAVDALHNERATQINRILDQLKPSLSEDDLRLNYLPLVIEDEMFNALALPGGTIVLFTGLLDNVQSDNEVAFVLAHELGHFHNRDHLRGMGVGYAVQLISLLLSGQQTGAEQLLMDGVGLMSLGYSRHQEKDADLYALDMLDRAGFDLSGGIAFMERISEMDGRTHFAQYFSTHPHSDERLLYLRKEMKRLHP